MKKQLNYLKALPMRAIEYKLSQVEAIVIATVLMITMITIFYFINPEPFGY